MNGHSKRIENHTQIGKFIDFVYKMETSLWISTYLYWMPHHERWIRKSEIKSIMETSQRKLM